MKSGSHCMNFGRLEKLVKKSSLVFSLEVICQFELLDSQFRSTLSLCPSLSLCQMSRISKNSIVTVSKFYKIFVLNFLIQSENSDKITSFIVACSKTLVIENDKKLKIIKNNRLCDPSSKVIFTLCC